MNRVLLLCLFFGLKIQAQGKLEVFFDFNKSEINSKAKSRLDSLISNQKNIQITKIYGYADKVDNSKYNDSISLKRARKVQEYFKTSSIRMNDDVEIKGFGENFKQSQLQSENRRVTIFYNNVNVEKKKEILTLTEKRIIEAKIGDKLVLENLLFYNHKGVILPESKPVLENLFQIMKKYPKLKIEIQGHICCQPVKDIGNISTARALTVYNYLLDNGIKKERLSYKAFGNKYPIYPIPEKTESERIANRRVEIEIIQN